MLLDDELLEAFRSILLEAEGVEVPRSDWMYGEALIEEGIARWSSAGPRGPGNMWKRLLLTREEV